MLFYYKLQLIQYPVSGSQQSLSLWIWSFTVCIIPRTLIFRAPIRMTHEALFTVLNFFPAQSSEVFYISSEEQHGRSSGLHMFVPGNGTIGVALLR